MNKVKKNLSANYTREELQHIEQVVNAVRTIYDNSMVQICDSSFKFRFVGSEFSNLLGIDGQAIIGKNLADINSPIQHLSREYYRLNSPVVKLDNVRAHYITYLKHENKLLVVENKVNPIKFEGKNLGIFIESHLTNDISKTRFDKLSSLNNNPIVIHNLNADNNITKIFSELEEFIIFLITIGKIDKEIASILQLIGISLSREGVSKIIVRNIFPKLQVTTRNQLIAKVYYLGLNNRLPKLLIHNFKLLHLLLVQFW